MNNSVFVDTSVNLCHDCLFRDEDMSEHNFMKRYGFANVFRFPCRSMASSSTEHDFRTGGVKSCMSQSYKNYELSCASCVQPIARNPGEQALKLFVIETQSRGESVTLDHFHGKFSFVPSRYLDFKTVLLVDMHFLNTVV